MPATLWSKVNARVVPSPSSSNQTTLAAPSKNGWGALSKDVSRKSFKMRRLFSTQATKKTPENPRSPVLSSPTANVSAKTRGRSSSRSTLSTSARQSQKPMSKKMASLLFYEPDQALLEMSRQMRTSSKSCNTEPATPTMKKSTITSGGGEGRRSLAASLSPKRMNFARRASRQLVPYARLECGSSMSDDGRDDAEKKSSAPSSCTASTEMDESREPASADSAAIVKASANALLVRSSSKASSKQSAKFLEKSMRKLGKLITKSTDKTAGTSAVKALRGLNGKKLPETGFYSSNHVMVNRERAMIGVPLLLRSRFLDSLAQSHVIDMADACRVMHSVESFPELRRLLHGAQAVGENVQRGKSIQAMHDAVMKIKFSSKYTEHEVCKKRHNILRQAYTEFGMATSLGSDGLLYMVQLFRGPHQEEEAIKEDGENEWHI